MSKQKLLILTSNPHLQQIDSYTAPHVETTIVDTVEACYYQIFKDPHPKFDAIFIVANDVNTSLREIISCINAHDASRKRFLICSQDTKLQDIPISKWKVSESLSESYKEYLESASKKLSWNYQFKNKNESRNDVEFQTLQHEYKILLDGAGEGIIGLSEEGNITFANKTASDILGIARSALIGQPFTNFSDDSPLNLGSKASTFEAFESRLRRVNRGIIRRGDGKQTYVEFTQSFVGNTSSSTVSIMVFEDISERIKFESKLIRLAHQDKLTGLYNRYYFEKSLKKELNNKRDKRPLISIALIDLDNFKDINDKYGHVTGDKLLILVGKRIRECIRRSDLAARLGGDEFCIIFRDASQSELDTLINKLKLSINSGFEIGEQKINVTASIGLCAATGEESIEGILSRADDAMYKVKRNGKNGFFGSNHEDVPLFTN